MAKEKEPLLAKLDELDARFSQIEEQIAEPTIASDSAKLVALSKEQGKLRTVVEKYREYKKTVAGIEDDIASTKKQ
ncbi:MAG: PCRF domain-containing protein [Planctomycetota bacterium]|jgi:peptide chain release factor 1